jgi:hypothetical protein
MKTIQRTLLLALTCAAAGLSSSCISSTQADAMKPAAVSAGRSTKQPVRVSVAGGSATTSIGGPGITDDGFKSALEDSLVQSGLFTKAGSGGYDLNAYIAGIEQPVMGFSMRVNMEVSYTLSRGGSVVWKKNIRTPYVAPMGEAFAGYVRLRKATEGAARENIAALIRSMDDASF